MSCIFTFTALQLQLRLDTICNKIIAFGEHTPYHVRYRFSGSSRFPSADGGRFDLFYLYPHISGRLFVYCTGAMR
jgi:hypothetical protein